MLCYNILGYHFFFFDLNCYDVTFWCQNWNSPRPTHHRFVIVNDMAAKQQPNGVIQPPTLCDGFYVVVVHIRNWVPFITKGSRRL